jgi:hypothetical protein
MNIVYAVKIFAALSIVAWVTKLIAGPGLRTVLDPKDLKTGWWGIVGTLAVCCFSVRVELFFVILPIWLLILSNMLGRDGTTGRLAAYALMLCISPAMTMEVEHIGPLNDLIRISPFRELSIFLLAPEAFRLAGRRNTAKNPPWLTVCDLATLTYALYWLLRHFSGGSISALGREVLNQLLDTLLPYYVLTRACVQTDVRHRMLGFLLLGAVYQAFVGMAESLSKHYLYSQLQWLYNSPWGQAVNLMRGSWLRAEAAFPGPLALAVLLLFAIGVWFVLKPPEKNRPYLIVVLALIGGLLATYGRGPMLAALVLVASIALLRRMSGKRYIVTMIVGAVVVAVGWSAGIGDLVLGLVGSAPGADANADFNVLYRQELMTTSLALLHQSPWWGVPNFIAQMQELRQGEGIIDLVNTYLVIALNVGSFGLTLFLIPYAITLWRGAAHMTLFPDLKREGSAWLALTVAMMAVIYTVSPISVIQPLMLWTVAIALARLQDRRGESGDQVDVPRVAGRPVLDLHL